MVSVPETYGWKYNELPKNPIFTRVRENTKKMNGRLMPFTKGRQKKQKVLEQNSQEAVRVSLGKHFNKMGYNML